MTDMQLGVSAEIEILKTAVTAGVFLGIIYDLFKIIRLSIKHGAVRFACDFLYALMFGAVFYVFSLAQTDYVRGFVFVGMLVGAAMWSATVGRLLVFLITRALKLAVGAVDAVIISPVFALINKIRSAMDRLFVKIKLKYENLKKIPKST